MAGWGPQLVAGLFVASTLIGALPADADHGGPCDTNVGFEDYHWDTSTSRLWLGPGSEVGLTTYCYGDHQATTYYRIETGPEKVYEEPFTPPMEETGPITVSYWSVSDAGIREETEQVTVWIDLTPPEVEILDPERGQIAYDEDVRLENPDEDEHDRAEIIRRATITARAKEGETELGKFRVLVDGEVRHPDPDGIGSPWWSTHGKESEPSWSCSSYHERCGTGQHDVTWVFLDMFGNAASATLPIDLHSEDEPLRLVDDRSDDADDLQRALTPAGVAG